MKTVMVSGHFDGIHDMHLDYLKQAWSYGNFMLCVVSSDEQLLMKKGKVNIPDQERAELLATILRGLGIRHQVIVNTFDTETPLVAKALRWWRPDIFCRGGDKTPETMPVEEKQACNECGITIVHTKFHTDHHSSQLEYGEL